MNAGRGREDAAKAHADTGGESAMNADSQTEKTAVLVDHGLADRLEHRFDRPSLLAQALTHASVVGHGGRARRSNERMEFLGDRVLGLIVAQLLYDGFPDEEEGALARRHAALVSRETLARVAGDITLGDFMRMSRGEVDAGGGRNPGLLADTCEAVIAAVYLDGGLSAAERFVHRYWRPLMGAALQPPKDAKTALQEWAQGRGLALPTYREVAREGPPHAPRFTVEVCVTGATATIRASGPSKRAAERAAAEELLEEIAGHGST